MTIQIGDRIPNATLAQATAEGPKPVSTDDIFAGKTVALFAVPGAFTPTCSARHLPGFKDHLQDIRDKGVDTVACISVNDAFVMKAWGERPPGRAATQASPSSREEGSQANSPSRSTSSGSALGTVARQSPGVVASSTRRIRVP